tara:strand:- start:113 stop:661 length:549 start_codon:yes stop_codon:yes gene_type:complete
MSGIITAGFNRSSGLMKAASAGGSTPGFCAYRGADDCSGDSCVIYFSDNTYTEAIYNHEEYDSDNCYDPSNGRFTPNAAGDYFILAQAHLRCHTDRYVDSYVEIRKNGSIVAGTRHSGEQSGGYSYDAEQVMRCSTIVTLNGSSDYVSVFIKLDVTTGSPIFQGGNNTGTRRPSQFMGFKLG